MNASVSSPVRLEEALHCMAPANLSFTRKLLGEQEAELNVCETGESTP